MRILFHEFITSSADETSSSGMIGGMKSPFPTKETSYFDLDPPTTHSNLLEFLYRDITEDIRVSRIF